MMKMKHIISGCIAFLACIIMVLPAAGALNTIPPGGTVFIGEQGLDITDTGVTSGSNIAWYGPGGSVTNVPQATVTVDNAGSFYVIPATFQGKTGPWFTQPGNNLAFYVNDPTIGIRVIDYTAGFTLSPTAYWLPVGDTAGFRIDTNLYTMANRPGVSGAPVTIKLNGPGGVQYSSVDGYSLTNIPVSSSPFNTGAVWATGSSAYARGDYTVTAECNANSMKDNYDVVGRTVSEPVSFLLSVTNPLITSSITPTTPTTRPTTVLTTVPSTAPTTAPPTTITTVPSTVPPTSAPTTVPPTTPPTTAPGFGIWLAGIAAFIAGIVVIRRS
ncbi:hypothetical protein J2741_000951 [Methanolinea mesophila]|uniref:DUF3821 domain-containing protein n=1 Tax=Methanolinea mesophila TaxID=547055 RepID=UPI001AE7B20F|nr:DUF3821 domain-containing protein [Methanolinea mesophila]MBP1928404.1 hypothetical protein [Methanolinea mesophila]